MTIIKITSIQKSNLYFIRILRTFFFASFFIQLYNTSMSLYFNEDSSDLNAYGNKKQSNLTRFLASITPQLLSDMKSYLARNLFKYETNNNQIKKITIYEDILAIVALKQNERQICQQKGKLRQVLLEISNKIKKKFVTVDERMRKKISRLNPEQLKYCMMNHKDIVCKGNSREINTDDWPQHLKTTYNKQPRKPPSIINLDDSESQPQTFQRNQSQNIEGTIKNRITEQNQWKIEDNEVHHRQIGMYENEQIIRQQRILNEYYQNESQNKQNNRQINSQKMYDLSNVIDRGVVCQKLTKEWKEKNIRKYTLNENNQNLLLAQSQICYNFRKRQYMFINPQIVMSLANKFRQEELINKIKLNYNRKNNQIQSQSNKQTKPRVNLLPYQNHDITKTKKILIPNMKKTFANQIDQPIQVQQIQDSAQRYSNQFIHPFQTNSQENGNLNQEFQPLNGKSRLTQVPNAIQLLKKIAQTQNLSQISSQVRELLENGLKIANELQQKLNIRMAKQNIQKEIISVEDNVQPDNSQLINNQQVGHNSQQQFENNSDQSGKPFIYYFNNDSRLYQTYQQDPYGKGYLMWSDDQDEILFKVNKNFDNCLNLLDCLIKFKSAEVVYDRILFLKIELCENFKKYMKRLLIF